MNTTQAGAEEFIWIVVGIFWVIAQIAGGALKKKTPAELPGTDANREPKEHPRADLIRKGEVNLAQIHRAQPHRTPAADIRPTIKPPSINSYFQCLENPAKNNPTLEKTIKPLNKSTLRRAMLSHIILSPPKALEGLKPV